VEFHDFIINSNPKKTTNVELLDPNVKKAFEYAIDRNKIVEVARLGFAQPGDSIVPPATGIWHDPSLKPLPFDLNAANQLLDQAGFAKGPDGLRVANGHPMAYSVIFAHDEAGPGDRAFQIIQADFQQIGVKLTQRALDDSAAFNAITAPGTTGYLNFDLAMWDWVPLIDPDFILSVVTCSQFGGWSDSGYCNPQYDQWYKQQSTLTKQSDRVALVYKMQDQIYNDRPYIVLNYDDQIEAHTKSWTGFVYSPQGSFNPLSKQTMTEIHQV
jgi:peptide/nickel transport system substrate-binding protein